MLNCNRYNIEIEKMGCDAARQEKPKTYVEELEAQLAEKEKEIQQLRALQMRILKNARYIMTLIDGLEKPDAAGPWKAIDLASLGVPGRQSEIVAGTGRKARTIAVFHDAEGCPEGDVKNANAVCEEHAAIPIIRLGVENIVLAIENGGVADEN